MDSSSNSTPPATAHPHASSGDNTSSLMGDIIRRLSTRGPGTGGSATATSGAGAPRRHALLSVYAAHSALQPEALRDAVWEALRRCVVLETVDGAVDTHSIMVIMSRATRAGRPRARVALLRTQLLAPMLVSVDACCLQGRDTLDVLRAMTRQLAVFRERYPKFRGNLRTGHVMWMLLKTVKMCYSTSMREHLLEGTKMEPELLGELRKMAGLAYGVLISPAPVGFLGYFSSAFTVALLVFFGLPYGLSDYISDSLHPNQFRTTIAVTSTVCIGFTLAVALTRFIRFEKVLYYLGSKRDRKSIESVYNSGRQRLQRALRSGATSPGVSLLGREPGEIRDKVAATVGGLKSASFGLASLAVGVLVLEFQPLGEAAFQPRIPAEMDNIVLVAQLLLISFMLGATGGILMAEVAKLIPEGSVAASPRVAVSISVYEDVSPYLGIAAGSAGGGAVMAATAAHIIAIVAYRVERNSSAAVLASLLVIMYAVTSTVAYTNGDIVLDEIDFDEGPLAKEGLGMCLPAEVLMDSSGEARV